MNFRIALLVVLAVPAASLVLQTRELKSFGTASSSLHPEATAKMLANIQDTWRDVAHTQTAESLATFGKSCKTVASAILSGSDGDHNRVQDYMTEVCRQSTLDKWHGSWCNKFKDVMGNGMMFNNMENRAQFNYDKVCSAFFADFSAQEAAAVKVAEAKAAEVEKVEAEKRAEQEKVEAKKQAEEEKAEAEALAWRTQKLAQLKKLEDAKKAEGEKQRLEQQQAEQKKMLMEASAHAAALKKEKAATKAKELAAANIEAQKASADKAQELAAAAQANAEAKAEVAKAHFEALKKASEEVKKAEDMKKATEDLKNKAEQKAAEKAKPVVKMQTK